jgi:DHA3 family macrolide efflux protein-like MFS transporter
MSTPSKETISKNWKAPFFTLWTGQAASLLGSQLVQFALIWWLTKTTGSATVLATASLVGLIPQVVLGPLVGALVDRWNRRVIMIVADSIIALVTIGLALLFLGGNVQIWQVYLLMFIRGAAGGFHWPAMSASTTLMVPKEHLSRIQGLNQMLQGGMNILAAPLGALLLEVLPIQGILAIDVGTAMLAIVPLFFIHVPQPERKLEGETPGGKPSVWQDMLAGMRYVWSWPALLIVIGMAVAINLLFAPAGALQPILVTQHFNGGALQLAWMQSSWGIGMFLGGLLLSAWGGFKRRILTTFVGLIVLGAGVVVVGLAPPWAIGVAVAMMFVAGFAIPIVNGPINAVLQASVEPEMQGRVFTLVSSLAMAMTPIGLIIAGPFADAFGVSAWYVMSGIVIVSMGVIGFFIPALIHIEDGRPDAARVGDGEQSVVPNPGD